MDYRYHSIPPALKKYVHCIWSLSTDNPQQQRSIIPISASGCIEMLYYSGQSIGMVRGDCCSNRGNILISGHKTHPVQMFTEGFRGIIGVMFKPFAARALLGIDANEFTNKTVTAEDALGKSVHCLRAWLDEVVDFDEKVRRVVEWMTGRAWEPRFFLDPRVTAAVNLLSQSGGRRKIVALEGQLQIGKRQLERLFKFHVGLSPKEFARTLRFQFALYVKCKYPHLSLTQLALECGYSDQAHFIREFKRFTCLTPRDYFSLESVMSDYFNFY